MTTLVKICGAQTKEDVKMIEQAGANFIGFVFAPSKRRVSFKQATQLIRSLSSEIKKVGVFVNPSQETIRYAIEDVKLDFIQLHGDESADLASQFPGKIIKAFPSDTELSYKEMFKYPAEYVLVDSPRKEHHGGSGQVFNWEPLDLSQTDTKRFALAGGLSPENVKEAIQKVHPKLVDVSSGVETNTKKDPKKINQFIHQVRSAN